VLVDMLSHFLGILLLLTDSCVTRSRQITSGSLQVIPGSGQAAFDWDYALAWQVTAVPVPAALWLFGSGLIGLVGVARRRKSA
jgi:hypothetical protein